MPAVLAIDAAWTAGEPSGVALVEGGPTGWTCVAVAPSYADFTGLANGIPVNWDASGIPGTPPNPVALLLAAQQLLNGANVDLVTVDMPVATIPIVGRRQADQAVSLAFGGKGCGTHTPNVQRPGPIGTLLSQGFLTAAFPIAVASTMVGTPNRLVEVYPHPALLSLMSAQYRIPYKVCKSKRYWPSTAVAVRVTNLLTTFGQIMGFLNASFAGIPAFLPAAPPSKLVKLKRYEDALDALVCAWVGTKYLSGQAAAYGDNTAVIWVP